MTGLSLPQYQTLRKPINATRIAKRQQGGKQLSYLESWDVRAHLIRVFGFGNFDVELLDQHFVGQREYESGGDTPKPMVEVSWFAKVRLTVRVYDEDRMHYSELCTYSDAAVGSTSGPATMIGEHHDNAIKTAASDALKRCAINLGTQFGLSLYDNGSHKDVVKGTLVGPEGFDAKEEISPEQIEQLKHSLGATEVEQKPEEDTPLPEGEQKQ